MPLGMNAPLTKQAIMANLPASRGLDIEFVRNLTPADDTAAALPQATEGHASVRIRTSHHALAKAVANGQTHEQASLTTGYSPGYIGILCKDPAFADLVSYYQTQALDEFVDYSKRLAAVGTTALEIIQDRMEQNPDKIGLAVLKDIVEMAFDRSVAPSKGGPKAGANNGPGGVNVNVTFSASPAPKVVGGDRSVEGGRGEPLHGEPITIEATVIKDEPKL